MKEKNKVSKFALLLATAEMGLGSFLHSFHIPLSGQLLSLNQIFILSIAKYKNNCSAIPISFLAAMFKISFANGKKLTPAFAISAQGLLFEIGSFISLYLGAALSSLWAFFQPVFLFYVISSGQITDIYTFYQKQMRHLASLSWFADRLVYLVLFCILLKILLAIALVWVSKATRGKGLDKYQSILNKPLKNVVVIQHQRPTLLEIFSDLFKPFYLISILIIAFFEMRSVYTASQFLVVFSTVLTKTIAIISLSRYGSFFAIRFIKNNHRFKFLYKEISDENTIHGILP